MEKNKGVIFCCGLAVCIAVIACVVIWDIKTSEVTTLKTQLTECNKMQTGLVDEINLPKGDKEPKEIEVVVEEGNPYWCEQDGVRFPCGRSDAVRAPLNEIIPMILKHLKLKYVPEKTSTTTKTEPAHLEVME